MGFILNSHCLPYGTHSAGKGRPLGCGPKGSQPTSCLWGTCSILANLAVPPGSCSAAEPGVDPQLVSVSWRRSTEVDGAPAIYTSWGLACNSSGVIRGASAWSCHAHSSALQGKWVQGKRLGIREASVLKSSREVFPRTDVSLEKNRKLPGGGWGPAASYKLEPGAAKELKFPLL